MKKLAIALLAAFVCGAAANAQPAKPAAKPEAKKEAKQEKQAEKLRTLTGVITAVDAAAGTITAESVKVKGEVMTFSYAGVKFMDGARTVEGSALKAGDRIKLKYEGDLKTPVIKKAMLMKAEPMKEKKETKKEEKGKK